jgi:ribosome maturation factor RimP
MELKQQIEHWLEPLLAEKNLYLTDIKLAGKSKVEIYVDGDEGIKIEQCVEISRFLEGLLDGSGIVSEDYTLDVSSPGMSNPLKVPRQYSKRIGRILEILKTDGTEIEAQLIAADEQKIVVKPVAKEDPKSKKRVLKSTADIMAKKETEDREIEIKYSDIKRALIQLKW